MMNKRQHLRLLEIEKGRKAPLGMPLDEQIRHLAACIPVAGEPPRFAPAAVMESENSEALDRCSVPAPRGTPHVECRLLRNGSIEYRCEGDVSPEFLALVKSLRERSGGIERRYPDDSGRMAGC